MTSPWNDAQRATLAKLRRQHDELPDFTGVGGDLLDALAVELDPLLDRWEACGGGVLRVTKWHLAGCERRRVEDQVQFAWNADKAIGTIVHQMIQSWCFDRHGLKPGALFWLAIERVQRDQTSLGVWINGGHAPVGELEERCCTSFTQFVECFPKPTVSMVPAVETRHVWQHGPLRCEIKVDLQLGADEFGRAGVVFVELKNGRAHPEHLPALHHYALIRALKLGIPPRAVALCSVADGITTVEQVTRETLAEAAGRLAAAVLAQVSLAEGRAPTETASPLCRWCPVLERCPTGQANITDPKD